MSRKHASTESLTEIAIDRKSGVTLTRQVCEAIRALITTQRLVPGAKMPSSREFAIDIAVSRTTIISAYDQLISEGYLIGRRGAGTFVENMPQFSRTRKGVSRPSVRPHPERLLVSKVWPLSPAASDLKSFPRTAWARAAARGQRRIETHRLFDFAGGGLPQLRAELAKHIYAMRGVSCDPNQIIVTSGIQETIELICGSVFTRGDVICTEEPGHPHTRKCLQGCGAVVAPSRVDDSGLNVDQLMRRLSNAKGVLVTASRQLPLGMPLSLDRRLKLVDWAARKRKWIIEDDYDSEFRFVGRPPQTIYSLDDDDRTIYLGSLSKVLFPNLRVSFIVAPKQVARRIVDLQNQRGSLASIPAQAALTEFMVTGQLATHIRHTRRLYARRYEHLLGKVFECLGDYMTPHPVDGGMHFVAHFVEGLAKILDDTEITELSIKRQIGALPLSEFYARKRRNKGGLLIGFSGTEEGDADDAVDGIRTIIEDKLSV